MNLSESAFDVCLASSSPRRRELLQQIGIRFRQLPVAVDETPRPDEDAGVYTMRMAVDKAAAGRRQAGFSRDIPVLAADTAVVLDREILGKPRDRDHGLSMLRALSGRTHSVMSAVALDIDGRQQSRLQHSRVRFRALEQHEIDDYWRTGEPVDKAGGYGIQGRAAVFVEHLEGSYSGVMGLPLYETWDLLRDFGLTPAEWMQRPHVSFRAPQ
jgi:septum formation protein